jgi:predicted N-acetyltransferase YhbS
VRPYRPGDETQLAALYAEAFGRERRPDVWRWKLMEREVSPGSTWVAATHEGERIVGHYGGTPLKLRSRGEERPVVHAVEAMSARDFRRQGILTRLGEAAHEAWGRAGYAAVLGLPNEQWGTRNYAVGFRRIFHLAWLRFPLHVERVVARSGRLPAPLDGPAGALAGAGSAAWRWTFRGIMRARMGSSDLHVEEAGGPGDFDRLWSRLAGEYENVVVRDGEWVDWRFVRAPTHHHRVLVAHKGGEPLGYIAYYLAEMGRRANGYIADIFVGRGDAATASALVKSTLEDLSARGAGMVLATAPPGSALYGRLRGLGFLPTPRRMAFNFEIAPLQPDVDPARLADPGTWHLTAGDFDVI